MKRRQTARPGVPWVCPTLALALSPLIAPVSAATHNWTDGTGNWNVPGNWSPASLPASGDAVNILFADGVARTITYNISAPSLGLLTVDLTGPGATASTISLPGNNTLAANGILIGGYNGVTSTLTAGRGAMIQSAGAVSTNPGWDFVLGYGANSTGNYTLSGTGALTANQSEYVGLYGSGVFNHSAGTNTIATATGFFDIGTYAGSSGTYNLSGTGVLTVKSNEYVGDIGAGVFNQMGGTHTLMAGSSLYVGYNASGAGGSYNLSAGDLTTSVGGSGAEYIGYNGAGAFTQTGGNNIMSSFMGLHVGTMAGSTGVYTLTAGMADSNGAEYIGESGTGTFTQSGGSNGVGAGNDILIGYNANSVGTYNLSGSGSLNSGHSIYIGYNGSGTFNQYGGVHTTDETLALGLFAGSTGIYNLSGGTLNATQFTSYTTFVGEFGTGIFNQSGGTSTFGANGIVLGAGLNGSGTFNLSGGSATVARDVFVGGSSPSGTGVLTVSGSGVLTVGGTLGVANSPGNVIDLDGGVINTAALNFNGSPGLFQWTTGTLNLTTDVTFDSGSSDPASTSDAFGPSLTLAANQLLMVSANETLGGRGSFSLELGAGSSHYVSGTLTVNPAGTITQDDGSTLYATTLIQAGGTINGTLQNQGNFIYQSGAFNGTLLNQGTVNLGPFFTAGNGVQNESSMTLAAGQTLTVNGLGLDNLGSLTLNGGVISGSGPAINEIGGTLQGHGTINTAITNNGLLVVAGVLRLNGGVTNTGVIQGSGTVIGNISNSAGGAINVAAGSQLAINSTWTNSGFVMLQGAGAVLGGASITNAATIQGTGRITSPITNTGVIRAVGGELDLAGTGNTNASGAQIQASAGNTVLFIQGLPGNAGTIALSGGTFDNNNQPLANTGSIEGNGIIRTGGLTNASGGIILFSDAASSVFGAVTNAAGANIKIVSNTTSFFGPVTNNGTIKVTNGIARFLGNGVSMTVGGTYNSDPSDNYFSGLSITSTGAVTGGVGDRFFLTTGTNLTSAGTFTNGGTLSAGTVTNSGTFIQTGTLTETANFTNSGAATIGGSQTWSSGTTFTNAAGTGTFQTDTGSISSAPLSINVTGGLVNFSSTQHLAGLSVASGATVVAALASPHGVIVTSSLNNSGLINLTNNSLIVQGTSAAGAAAALASIAGELKSGFSAHAGYWNGVAGIISTAAAGDTRFLTTLGYRQSAGGAFDGASTTSNDVIIKYTYYGDADLNGTVDGADYHQIDNGFGNSLTGWTNGDFNYDRVVDGADYTLIDNSFNQLAATALGPPAIVASPTNLIAVPEPLGLGLVGIGLLGLVRRRRRSAAK